MVVPIGLDDMKFHDTEIIEAMPTNTSIKFLYKEEEGVHQQRQ